MAPRLVALLARLYALAAVAMLTAAASPVHAQRDAPADPAALDRAALDRVVTLNNVALGMARREIRARVLRDPGCAEEPGTPPRTLMMACGAAKFTAMFTGDDRAWSVRTSLDATGRAALVADGRGRLAARYGPPTAVVNDGTTLIWTARPMPAAGAQGCWLRAGLLAAAREAPSGPRPRIDPGCLPLRYAIVAGSNGHAGLIVEQQDPAMGLPRAR